MGSLCARVPSHGVNCMPDDGPNYLPLPGRWRGTGGRGYLPPRPSALKAAVHLRAKRGCEVVKVMASGDATTPGGRPGKTFLVVRTATFASVRSAAALMRSAAPWAKITAPAT